jgi:transposase-like protein
VVDSLSRRGLQERGEQLLTFSEFPENQLKTLGSTSVTERLHAEFRRRVTTQGGLPAEAAMLVILFGLVAGGQMP